MPLGKPGTRSSVRLAHLRRVSVAFFELKLHRELAQAILGDRMPFEDPDWNDDWGDLGGWDDTKAADVGGLGGGRILALLGAVAGPTRSRQEGQAQGTSKRRWQRQPRQHRERALRPRQPVRHPHTTPA